MFLAEDKDEVCMLAILSRRLKGKNIFDDVFYTLIWHIRSALEAVYQATIFCPNEPLVGCNIRNHIVMPSQCPASGAFDKWGDQIKCLQCEVEADGKSAMLEQNSIGFLSIRKEMMWSRLVRLRNYHWPCRNPSALWPSLVMTASIASSLQQ